MSETLSVPLEREALAILVQNPGAKYCRELSEADFTKPRDVIFSAPLRWNHAGSYRKRYSWSNSPPPGI
jgi:hypothetical protein